MCVCMRACACVCASIVTAGAVLFPKAGMRLRGRKEQQRWREPLVLSIIYSCKVAKALLGPGTTEGKSWPLSCQN